MDTPSILAIAPAVALPLIGLGTALWCIATARRASERALPAGGDVRALRRAFAVIAVAAVAYVVALPLAITALPAAAAGTVVVTLSGGFAWTIALQAMRLRALAGDAGLAVPAIAAPALREVGPRQRWTGLGATLLGMSLAMAGALSGALFAALG